MRRDEGRGKKEREKVGEGGREGWLVRPFLFFNAFFGATGTETDVGAGA